MRNRHNYFYNLKRQYKRFIINRYDIYVASYALGRLRAYIDAGYDTGVITFNTWHILKCRVDKLLKE